MNDYTKYLNPQVVAQLANMELRAKLVVEGFITGLHKSPYHGFSVEFTEHRQYNSGEDIKHIDWKLFGKTDRYYVKQYEEETNLKSYIILDKSKSMDFSSNGRIKKYEYASYIAAALSYLMIEQRDAVGLTLFDETIATHIPPRATRSHLKTILKEIELLQPIKRTNIASSLNIIAEKIKRRGLIIILSDLLDEPDAIIKALKHFRYKGNEVIVLHILDLIETNFNFGNAAIFKDMETGEEITTQPYHIQNYYIDTFEKCINKYKQACRDNNIDYVLLKTDTTFDKALFAYLNKRKNLL